MISSARRCGTQNKRSRVLIDTGAIDYSSQRDSQVVRPDFRKAIGTARLIMFVMSLIPFCVALIFFGRAYNVEHNWQKVTAEVDSSSVSLFKDRTGVSHVLNVFYHYRVGDTVYLGEDHVNQGDNPNKMTASTITAFCDPKAPTQSRLFPGYDSLLGWCTFVVGVFVNVAGLFISESQLASRYNSGYSSRVMGNTMGDDPARLAREIITRRHPIAGVDPRRA